MIIDFSDAKDTNCFIFSIIIFVLLSFPIYPFFLGKIYPFL